MTTRHITFRVTLTSAEDIGSKISRERLEDAFVQLLLAAGASVQLCGLSYTVAGAKPVGR